MADTYGDYPQSAVNNAKRGIKLNKEVNNKCATSVGKQRARDIVAKRGFSLSVLKRVYSYLSRAKEYYNPSDKEACGTISYLLWGGESMRVWSKRKLEKIEKENNNLIMKKNYNKITVEGLERRNFNNSEIRLANSESREVVGYASVFTDAEGNPALSENLGGFREKISPNAFDSVLENDVRALFNHDPNLILGRTKANTLNLSVDERGLKYSFTAPDTTTGRDLMVSLERGDITQSSFGFIVEEDEWEEDEEGTTIRTIKKVGRLLDISPVTYPAYPDAEAGRRSFLNYRTEKEKQENKKQEQYQIKRELLDKKIKLLKLKNSY